MSNDQSIFMYLQCPYSEKFYKNNRPGSFWSFIFFRQNDRVNCKWVVNEN